MKGGGFRRVIASISRYAAFFLAIAFVITCCTMLFVTVLSENLGVKLTGENLETAAKLTLINVLFLSLVYTVIDAARRKITVGVPVKRITEAAEKMMHGDFSVRITPVRESCGGSSFNSIIECFNKVAQELSGTETLRTDFIANVSHELKTPLSVIVNYSKLMQHTELSEEKRMEYAEVIGATAKRLADLVSNILKLSKLENQQIFPKREKYNLGEQLCECLLSFENAWEVKNIKISTDIAEDVYVESDAELLSLVWNNLFSNAVKFTDDGGRISVRMSCDAECAVVTVEDTGCGISPEIGAHIFEKFYQGDTSHSEKGNGLGLALVKRVADITGSDIFVQSEAGKGSTFTVKVRRGTDEKTA